MVIRPLERRDLSRGLVEALSSLSEVGINHPARLVEVFEARQRQGTLTFVCVDRERVIGTASLVVEQKFIHHGGKVGHVEDVAVHPHHRSRGVGQHLVEHAIEAARQLGCYKVILNCTDRLIGFYEQAGFRKHTHGMRLDLPAAPPALPLEPASACAFELPAQGLA